jgi:hypothetical protein
MRAAFKRAIAEEHLVRGGFLDRYFKIICDDEFGVLPDPIDERV